MSNTAITLTVIVGSCILWSALAATWRRWERSAAERFDRAHPTLLALHRQATRSRHDQLPRVTEGEP